MIELEITCPRCGAAVGGTVLPLPSEVCLPCPGCGKGVGVTLAAFATEHGPVLAVVGVAAFHPAAVAAGSAR